MTVCSGALKGNFTTAAEMVVVNRKEQLTPITGGHYLVSWDDVEEFAKASS